MPSIRPGGSRWRRVTRLKWVKLDDTIPWLLVRLLRDRASHGGIGNGAVAIRTISCLHALIIQLNKVGNILCCHLFFHFSSWGAGASSEGFRAGLSVVRMNCSNAATERLPEMTY